MIIKTFQFNPLQVNTYILYDEHREAIIIDPGMITTEEEKQLQSFVEENTLTIKHIICTHPHFDHVLGNAFCMSTFHAPLLMHKDGMKIYTQTAMYCSVCGLDVRGKEFPSPTHFITENEIITAGNIQLTVINTPGHAVGSVSLYAPYSDAVFVGDLLFQGSVGRADLPSGNMLTLLESIKSKIYVLPDHTVVYPGHGETTKVGDEKKYNIYTLR